MSKNVLITGGAGYIGSVVARSFIARGDNVIIVDDLSHSTIHSIPKDSIFYNSNINNKDVIIVIIIEIYFLVLLTVFFLNL